MPKEDTEVSLCIFVKGTQDWDCILLMVFLSLLVLYSRIINLNTFPFLTFLILWKRMSHKMSIYLSNLIPRTLSIRLISFSAYSVAAKCNYAHIRCTKRRVITEKNAKDSAPPPPLIPSQVSKLSPLSQSSCVSPVELPWRERGGKELARSQIYNREKVGTSIL